MATPAEPAAAEPPDSLSDPAELLSATGRAGPVLPCRHSRARLTDMPWPRDAAEETSSMNRITTACLDMAGTTVADDGSVMAAFAAAMEQFGLAPGAPGYDEAAGIVHETMGQSKIEVFRRVLGQEAAAQTANRAFEQHYATSVRAGAVAPVPGAAETITALRAAGIRVCLATGFSSDTRDTVLDVLGWRQLIDLALSPADAGRGRPWPDLPLTALLRLGGGAVSELVVAGDTASDIESGLRAGAGLVAGVLTGSGSRDELEQAGAPYILDAVTSLLPLLGLDR